MNLEDMKAARRKLDRQIAEAEKSEAEKKRNAILAARYVQVACPSCCGTGEYSHQLGSDNMDFSETSCQDCGGRGYLWARKWTGLKHHELDLNQVCAP
jgi:DnaJ-class molecular chaperone